MKKCNLLVVVSTLLLITACSTTKNSANNDLFGSSWELEYLSGPRIAFNGLFPNKKPKISFDKSTQKVQGNNGCNGYSADYTLNGNDISFGEPGPTTMMFCGEGESFFLNTIKKVNKFSFDTDGKLNLLINDVPMMRFVKSVP